MSSAAKRKRKKRSQAPVALVYVVTVLIFMALISMLSIYLLKTFHIIDDKKEEEPVVTVQTFNDLFARVNSKGVLSDMTLIRIDPTDNSVLVVPISALTLNSANKVTMRETFAQAGMAGVKEAVEGTLGMKIDNYATLSNDAFERVCDIYGGITYMATEELYYISKDNDENDITIMKGEMSTLSGRQIRLLTQYPVFSKGKQGNNEFLGEAMESLINNMFLHSNITSDNLDNLYNIITTNSDTDMNMDDFKLQKSYIKDMLSEGIVPAEKLVPEGVWADKDENFTISEDFITKLKEKAAETTPELGGGTAIEKTPVQDSAAAGRVIVE
ncbi:LCP family protein [uncultured Ruminococcus sp.]|uniref:LCP family glycopolymer transferase n=1 Tax=uncultured Ruminococcus sp. TaxID=165186 RepID=UPI000EC9EC50|nr:LCP family protein [uncultured Ruminococcus sp.]HCJ41572.1 LytR family transcriptional regulator [Ruminococcus sp.]